MTKIYRNPDVMWREEDDAVAEAIGTLDGAGDASGIGTAILFSDGLMVSLNLLGTEIWKRCDAKSVDELAEELLMEFDVDAAELSEDLTSFLAELTAKGFIRYA